MPGAGRAPRAEQLRGEAVPAVPGARSPSRPCPRYLRGGRRSPLVERGGCPSAGVERRAEAGGGQAGGPVRVLHPGRDSRERRERRIPLRPRGGGAGSGSGPGRGAGRVNRPARAAPALPDTGGARPGCTALAPRLFRVTLGRVLVGASSSHCRARVFCKPKSLKKLFPS